MPSPNECLPVEPIHRLGPGGEVLEPPWLLLTSRSYELMVTSLLSGPELGQQETGQHLHSIQSANYFQDQGPDVCPGVKCEGKMGMGTRVTS